MRNQLLRLQKYNSTKAERRVGEILKRNRIKFKARQNIGKYEADFVIGNLILEVDGSVHRYTNSKRDAYFASRGFVPVHIRADSVKNSVEGLEDELLILIKKNN